MQVVVSKREETSDRMLTIQQRDKWLLFDVAGFLTPNLSLYKVISFGRGVLR